MTVIVPTATSMKLKFPEFADTNDVTLEFAIEEASMTVTDAWDVQGSLALMYFAAHLVAAGKVAALALDGGSGGAIASESIGRMSISYKTSTSSNSDATADDMSTSTYGRRYIELRALNFGGPIII